nr:MAG TPA: hypothetical protein [Caudoviricetes sp.]
MTFIRARLTPYFSARFVTVRAFLAIATFILSLLSFTISPPWLHHIGVYIDIVSPIRYNVNIALQILHQFAIMFKKEVRVCQIFQID